MRKYLFNIDDEIATKIIKDVRKGLGLNQSKMADKMGMSLRQYQRFETMQGMLQRKYIDKFFKVTGFTSDEFYNKASLNTTRYGILNDVHTKYSSDIEGLDEIIEALKHDKVLFKIVLTLVRHMKTLENINK